MPCRSKERVLFFTVLTFSFRSNFTHEAEKELNANLQQGQLPQKINKAVSFNAIKNMACDLFFNQNQQDQQVINEKLTELFMTGTIVQRKDRSPPRDKISPRRSLNYQKRNRKHVF